MIARVAAWAILAASIALATTALDPPPADPPSPSPFRVVSGDFHVHGFLGDGALPPWDIRREAARRGLDAVALTNHNQMYAGRLERRLFSPPAYPLMLFGQELTTPTFHVIALGIRETIDWRLPIADAVRGIHAQGGVAIGAHPAGDEWQRVDDATLAMFDGLEVAHPARVMDATARARMDAVFARARRLDPSVAAIGSSDYHFGAPMGWSRTRLFVRDLTVEGVLEAIRAGRTVAYDPDGVAYGDPQWVTAAAAVPSATVPPSARRHRLAMAFAWAALVVLIVFGRKGVRS